MTGHGPAPGQAGAGGAVCWVGEGRQHGVLWVWWAGSRQQGARWAGRGQQGAPSPSGAPTPLCVHPWTVSGGRMTAHGKARRKSDWT